ncbi:MAG: hypothetical protein Unbinned706contig1000_29 [Prokaryotic dsDNA virus sp.]|nr:MAG: hypothetical protein Unbinned706contig1000_29 [Prokaryotic dsDNA virus sp.]|tara:strand:+ start:27845 stop:28198 length:354 start_codon:yes stop_codon:yes gene_type:complete
MIGASKTQSVNSGLVTPIYTVSISPGFIEVFSDNGSSTSPFANSSVNNGVGPYEYLWTITGSDISIVTSTDSRTRFSASGFNSIYSEVATLTVTDKGNGDAQTSKNITVSFDFESGA